MSAVWRFLKNYGLFGLWLIAVTLISSSYFGDERDPDHYFASNTREAFYWLLIVISVEVAALFLVLRPRSYRRAPRRPLVALMLFGPWAILNVMISMHAQTMVLLHTLWLILVVCPLLVILFVVSGVAVIAERRRDGAAN